MSQRIAGDVAIGVAWFAMGKYADPLFEEGSPLWLVLLAIAVAAIILNHAWPTLTRAKKRWVGVAAAALLLVVTAAITAMQWSARVEAHARELSLATSDATRRAAKIAELEERNEELERRLTARTSGLVGRWGARPDSVPPGIRLYVDLRPGVLVEEVGKSQVGLVCRAFDQSIPFESDPIRQASNWFPIGSNERIEMVPNDDLLKRIATAGAFECAVALAPLGEVPAGTRVRLLDRVARDLSITLRDLD